MCDMCYRHHVERFVRKQYRLVFRGAAGQADIDSDSTTACVSCPIGTYAGLRSTTCVACSDTGQFDDDRDPTTPCANTNICIQECAAGFQDEDCDDATPCTACDDGEYLVWDRQRSVGTRCAPGRTDDDIDASTPCVRCAAGYAAVEGQSGPCETCSVGQYAPVAADVCTNCTAGFADDDSQPHTLRGVLGRLLRRDWS